MRDDTTAEPATMASYADKLAFEATPFAEKLSAGNAYEMLTATAKANPDLPAISFQLKGGPDDRAVTLTWKAFHAQVTQTANALRALGVGPDDTVAILMPNAPETAAVLMAGMTAGVVAPINPLLESRQIAALLRETRAKALVTLAPLPKTDIAAKAAYAARNAPACRTILEVDLTRYLGAPMAWVAKLIAPKRVNPGSARVLSFHAEVGKHAGDALAFPYAAGPDDVCAYFHTGGTTGAPKVAVHRHRGALYNGWLVDRLLLKPGDAMMCPLPMFHVLAAYPMLMACIASGAHFVIPTPAGYRGEGVIQNFWKLCERWKIKFVTTVPTAVAALMQRPVNADLSRLQYAISGSAPMPPELFRRFEKETGVKLLEGYGQTETTCLISCNPPAGVQKIGSVGLPFPYTDVMILNFGPGGDPQDVAAGEVGEICVRSPGAISGYLEESRNATLFAAPGVIRTGDLGRLDADNYLWITGRAKDLIIRGGHNIDPAVIEDALMAHPQVAFVGAIGQPDAYAGEMPCAYVELIEGATVDADALRDFAAERVSERAARPRFVGILPELPKTAVGKVFKPDLRKMALERVFAGALKEAGIEATVIAVDNRERGLLGEVTSDADDAAVTAVLGAFARPWRRAG